jgi:hypothetical protein
MRRALGVITRSSLKQVEVLGDKVSMSLILHNLGVLYSDQGNYAQSAGNFSSKAWR